MLVEIGRHGWRIFTGDAWQTMFTNMSTGLIEELNIVDVNMKRNDI